MTLLDGNLEQHLRVVITILIANMSNIAWWLTLRELLNALFFSFNFTDKQQQMKDSKLP